MLDRAGRFRRWGREESALRAFEAALCTKMDRDQRSTALTGLASALDALGRGEEAAGICLQAIDDRPVSPEAFAILALVHLHGGDLVEAARRAGEACARAPRAPALLCLSASIALRRGSLTEAAAGAAAVLALDPGNARARAIGALADLALGKPCPDLDAPGLVRRAIVPTHPGFGEALAGAIRSDPALCPARRDGVLQGGWRLDDVFTLEFRLTETLRGLVLDQAGLLAGSLAESPAHAHFGAVPETLTLRGWANVMRAGHCETPHIHERAWMSAVYYPALPETDCGDILFGPHDLGPTVAAPEAYAITPEVDTMVVFPAHLYHSTRPFAGSGERISVAFDLYAA